MGDFWSVVGLLTASTTRRLPSQRSSPSTWVHLHPCPRWGACRGACTPGRGAPPGRALAPLAAACRLPVHLHPCPRWGACRGACTPGRGAPPASALAPLPEAAGCQCTCTPARGPPPASALAPLPRGAPPAGALAPLPCLCARKTACLNLHPCLASTCTVSKRDQTCKYGPPPPPPVSFRACSHLLAYFIPTLHLFSCHACHLCLSVYPPFASTFSAPNLRCLLPSPRPQVPLLL